ncbi:Gfo/Idh/MocA family protein [Labrys wisconsinensis]|uniref:Dehydrogenase n=1 Tax=Labrys wisconsinensis TaxID=425677 RepID=A0ABU0J0W9_9HYPH|nr:Gfo/Idh/MocA family oxidoreductase [Labrys wisconsinensis]MDQ0467906.1 putative dehydrogenase [Labrys wisconsinensis]
MSIRVGLIGLGEVAQLMHLPLLADDPRFRIAAVMDVSPSLLAHVAARYGVGKTYADARALLGDPEIDAVFILTPDHLHAGLLSQAMDAGKHVFIEKPVCLTLAELEPILPRAATYGKTLFVGYMRRFSRPFLELKRRLPPADEIIHVRIRDLICEGPFFIRQTRPVFYPTDVPRPIIEAGRAETDRLLRSAIGERSSAEQRRAYQVLTGLSSHSFSAMRELFGMPQGLHAAVQHKGERIVALFDYGHFTAVYEAVINNVARFDAGIEVLTDRQQFRVTYDTPYVRNLPTQLTVTTSTDTDTHSEIVGPSYEDPFRIELDAFHDCIAGGARPKTTLEDARQDLDLFAAVGRAFPA